jgi:hypothetical protein
VKGEEKPPGRFYRVIKRLGWIEGGRLGPGGQWEGGEPVTYEPGDTVYLGDHEVESIYHKLEALDDAGRAILEKARAKRERPAKRIASLNADQRSTLAWALAKTKVVVHGEGLKETLLWAILNGAELPNDLESREWLCDALAGKLDPARGRGRPRKKQGRDMIRSAVEHGIAEVYRRWFADFQRDRDLAWLHYDALRLQKEHPDAAVWDGVFFLHTEEGRQSYVTALTDLGARPCPPATQRGAPTARELALRATAEECSQRWKDVAGKPLTPDVVARIVTRAKKSE